MGAHPAPAGNRSPGRRPRGYRTAARPLPWTSVRPLPARPTAHRGRRPAGADDLEAVMAADADATLPLARSSGASFRESDRIGPVPIGNAGSNAQTLKRSPPRTRHAARGRRTPRRPISRRSPRGSRQLIARDGKHVRQAFILRRVLRSDPGIRDYAWPFETGASPWATKGATTARSLSPEAPKRLRSEFSSFIWAVGAYRATGGR